MSAAEVVAEVVNFHDGQNLSTAGYCVCGVLWTTNHLAVEIVAALAAASPQVQAEAIGGEVEKSGFDWLPEVPVTWRAVGPWREVDQPVVGADG
jgi:hypothetical protein